MVLQFSTAQNVLGGLKIEFAIGASELTGYSAALATLMLTLAVRLFSKTD